MGSTWFDIEIGFAMLSPSWMATFGRLADYRPSGTSMTETALSAAVATGRGLNLREAVGAVRRTSRASTQICENRHVPS